MIDKIGTIQGKNLKDLHQWCEDHKSILSYTVSRYATGRQELWIKQKCDLKKNPTITEGFRDDRLESLGNRVLSNFDIGLLLFYPKGIEIKPHRDHTVFDTMAVCINLGKANFFIGEENYNLSDGEIIKFNCKIVHGVQKVDQNRWSIIFWHLKEKYKNNQGNLFNAMS